MTTLLGIAGALIGGFLATWLGFGGLSGFDLRSVIIAALGSVLLIVLVRMLRR